MVGKRLRAPETGSTPPGGGGAVSLKHGDASWTCQDCPLRDLPFCSNVTFAAPKKPPVRISRNQIKARQTIHRKDQTTDQIYVIREGWAFRYAITASGRRQILSFLMPGDLMASQSIFNDRMVYPVQSITDVAYCGFDRADLQKLVAKSASTTRVLVDICADERLLSEERLIDLGTRSAEERVARFLLEIMRRLDKRGRVHNQMFNFPLKQLHLADALGLTQVHVNRVLKRLRESGMIEWSRGVLKVVDLPGMRQIADMR